MLHETYNQDLPTKCFKQKINLCEISLFTFSVIFLRKCQKNNPWTHSLQQNKKAMSKKSEWHCILHVRISLSNKFQLKLTILTFWTKFLQNGCFRSKTEKVNNAIEFFIFELVQVTHFSLNWKFWFFRSNLPKKGVSGLKQKKWTAPLNFAYSVSLSTKF